jgi:outer membrane protein assembly factor BamB
MSKPQRIGSVLVSFGLLTVLILILGLSVSGTFRASAQVMKVAPPGATAKEPEESTTGMTLEVSNRYKNVLREVEKFIRENEKTTDPKAWEEPLERLQEMLSQPQDQLAEVRSTGTKQRAISFVSIRDRANQLLASLPPHARKIYESSDFGKKAANELKEAKLRGDPARVAKVAQEYLYTEAGVEALIVRATYHLSSDEPKMAALCFDNLLRRVSADQVNDWTLTKMAIAYYRDGRKDDGDRVWGLIEARADRQGGIRIGKDLVALDKVEQVLKGFAPDVRAALADYPYFRGGPGRTEQGLGGAPFLEGTWNVPTLSNKADVKNWTETAINTAVTNLENRGQPPLHAFFPVAVGKYLLYRTYDGVFAANLKKEGKAEWWHLTEGGVQQLMHEPTKRQFLQSWSQQYQQTGMFGAMFENSVIGTLSTDGTRAFFIDDLVLPPPNINNMMWMGNPGMQQQFGPLTEAVNRNTLKCVNLETGKLHWELGGKFDAGEFKDTFFLGAPLVLGGKLYLLNEKNSEARLVCLEPKDTHDKPVPPEVVWVQSLGTAQDKAQYDYHRRTHAVHIAYSEGILVVPTNAGAVYGIDLMDHSYKWVYPYREPGDAGAGGGAMPFKGGRFRGQPMPIVNPSSDWKASAPAVIDGKVVFTAPDSDALHCIDLRTGTPVWKTGRASDDLYFAGSFAGKALVVGKNYVRGIRLDNGQSAGKIDINGSACGQGAASENVYYLPVTKVGPAKQSGVLGIDMERFVAKPLNPSRKGEAPGNLIFYDGQVFSQTLKQVTAFPQVQYKLRMIAERIKNNPKDPVGLVELGELSLDKGDLKSAYDALHTAMENSPPVELLPKAKLKLYETLSEMLQRDFNGTEKLLDEYKALCVGAENPEERQRRTGEYLCLVGKGREDQGKLLEAFDAYMQFGALAGNKERIGSRDEQSTKARPDVWARGRIAAMLTKAKPDQRKPLEDKIATEWKTISDTKGNDVNALRHFVNLFGSAFPAGKQARLQLAERLIADSKDIHADELREAQLHLLFLANDTTEPQLAGQAVDALARLMLRKGLVDHAAFYYRKLGTEFPKVVIREEKTGAELYSEIATDPRFLPYLEDPRQSWNGKFKTNETFGNFEMRPTFALEGTGELLPFFQRHRFSVDVNSAMLRVVNQQTNQEVWKSTQLPSLQYLNLLQNAGQQAPRTTYTALGHIAVINLGHMVYGIDPVDQKKLWEFNLYDPEHNPANPNQANPMQVAPDGNGHLVLLYNDNYKHILGQTGVVSPGYVCLQTRFGLYALDPAKGSVLWTKSDITGQAVLIGDDRHIYAVEIDDHGQPTSCQAIRVEDGVSVPVADFAAAYKNRLRIIGHTILAQEKLAENKVGLRLYDISTGKDVWSQEFPAGSHVLQGEDSVAAGAVSPDGQVSLLDLKTGKPLFKTSVSKADVDKLQNAHLLSDRDTYYLLLNKPNDGKLVQGVWTNIYHGMQSLPLNGTVHAFEADSGKLRWRIEVANQQIVLEQFKDLPMLLFTARVNKFQNVGAGGFGVQQQVAAVLAIHKQTGKRLYDKELPSNGQTFHMITADQKAGAVEMISFQFKIRFALENPNGEPMGNAQPAPGGDTGLAKEVEQVAQPVAQPVRVRPVLKVIRD